MSSEMIAPDLPPYSLDIQSMELGDDTKAVGLNCWRPRVASLCAAQFAAQIWSAAFPPLAAKESLVVDFFSHLERVREFCKLQGVAFREIAQLGSLVLTQPSQEQLRLVFERFEKETFGIRVGPAAEPVDAVLEDELSHRGLDISGGLRSLYILRGVRTGDLGSRCLATNCGPAKSFDAYGLRCNRLTSIWRGPNRREWRHAWKFFHAMPSALRELDTLSS